MVPEHKVKEASEKLVAAVGKYRDGKTDDDFAQSVVLAVETINLLAVAGIDSAEVALSKLAPAIARHIEPQEHIMTPEAFMEFSRQTYEDIKKHNKEHPGEPYQGHCKDDAYQLINHAIDDFNNPKLKLSGEFPKIFLDIINSPFDK